MKKSLIWIVVLVLSVSMVVVFSFAGCKVEEKTPAEEATPVEEEVVSEKEQVTINFMADTRSELDKMVELLPDFEKETGIKVNYMALQETPLRSKTGLELSAPSTDISVVMLDFVFLFKYAKVGYLEPLDNYMEAIETFKKEDFQKPFIDACSYEGKLYGLPLYHDCNILMYRADLFAKYDLNVPKNYDELEQVAKVIHEEEPGVTGIAMRGQRGYGVNEWSWPTFLWGFGGSYYTEDMKGNLDSPEAIAALEYYTNLLNNYGPEGVANYSYVEVQTDLMEGRTGMIIDSATLGIRCEDPEVSAVAGKLGYAVVPGNVDVQPGFYSWTLAIPANSQNKEAAAKFAAWLASPEIAATVGWSAPNQALEEVYQISAYADYDQSKPLIKVMKDSLALADADYRPRIDEASEVGTAVSIAISEVLAGEKSAKDALEDANKEVNRILEEAGY